MTKAVQNIFTLVSVTVHKSILFKHNELFNMPLVDLLEEILVAC